jgi:hypothetical protein
MAPNEIVLERGACTLWSAPNTASWFIPKAVTMAAQDRGWQIFYAYADPAAGEVGTIYRACSWTYLGQGSPGRRSRPREYYQRGGERPITERAFRKRGYILADMDLLGWRRIMVPPKHRYAHVEIWRNGYHDKRAERALSIRLKNKRTS